MEDLYSPLAFNIYFNFTAVREKEEFSRSERKNNGAVNLFLKPFLIETPRQRLSVKRVSQPEVGLPTHRVVETFTGVPTSEHCCKLYTSSKSCS